MKVNYESKYFKTGLTIFLTALAILAVFFVFFRFSSINPALKKLGKAIAPLVYGFIFAYLISPLLNFIESKIFSPMFAYHKWKPCTKKGKNKVRAISVTITLLVVIALFYMFFATVIPEVYKSIATIISQYSDYTQNLVNWINKIMERNPKLASFVSDFVYNYSDETESFVSDSLLPMISKVLLPNINQYLATFSASLLKIFQVLWNIFIGIIVSVYVLLSKEKFINGFKKLVYSVMQKASANKFLKGIKFAHTTFLGFLSGKVIDSLIIGVLCYICLLIMKMPYALLVSFIVGVTNIIPFVGPFLGAIPSAIIILMVEPKKALYFLIFVLILQQVDGNIIGPKILSGTTGITSFGIIVAITIFGGLWGLVGMVIGVPLLAIMISIYSNIVDKKLVKKQLPVKGECYRNLIEISEEGKFVRYEYMSTDKDNERYRKFADGAVIIWGAIKKASKFIGGKIKNLFKKSGKKKEPSKPSDEAKPSEEKDLTI